MVNRLPVSDQVIEPTSDQEAGEEPVELENYDLLISMLDQNFHVDSTAFTFLKTHQFLAPLLVSGHPHIRACFPDSDVYIETVVDPETNDNEQVVVAIAPTVPPSEALARYQQLKQQWLIPITHQAQGKIVVLLGYQ